MLTYEQSYALTIDIPFRGRIKIACLKFAAYIMDEAGNVPAHNVRMKWASQVYAGPDGVASQIQNPTVMDPAVQQDGDKITDPALQTAVEGVVNKML